MTGFRLALGRAASRRPGQLARRAFIGKAELARLHALGAAAKAPLLEERVLLAKDLELALKRFDALHKALVLLDQYGNVHRLWARVRHIPIIGRNCREASSFTGSRAFCRSSCERLGRAPRKSMPSEIKASSAAFN